MECESSRPFKIDLVISKRKKNTMLSSITQPNSHKFPASGKSSHRQMINLTVNSRQQSTVPSNPEAKTKKTKISISEFMIEERQKEQIDISNTTNLLESSNMLISVYEASGEDEQSNKWWQYLKNSEEEDSKLGIVVEILKKEKKIDYFEQLLSENIQKWDDQKRETIKRYQQYIKGLKQLCLKEKQQTKCLIKIAEARKTKENEDSYRQLRIKINRDGKHGLNFSPKQASVFSGMSGSILMSKDTSEQSSVRKIELFSFGSNNKSGNKTKSANKEQKSVFLNPGRACVSKRQLKFNEA